MWDCVALQWTVALQWNGELHFCPTVVRIGFNNPVTPERLNGFGKWMDGLWAALGSEVSPEQSPELSNCFDASFLHFEICSRFPQKFIFSSKNPKMNGIDSKNIQTGWKWSESLSGLLWSTQLLLDEGRVHHEQVTSLFQATHQPMKRYQPVYEACFCAVGGGGSQPTDTNSTEFCWD